MFLVILCNCFVSFCPICPIFVHFLFIFVNFNLLVKYLSFLRQNFKTSYCVLSATASCSGNLKAFLSIDAFIASDAILLLSSDAVCLCFCLLLDRLVRLLFVTVVLVLEADGVETGGSFKSVSDFSPDFNPDLDPDFDPASEVVLPSTVAGLRRRIVAADSGPERELIGAKNLK